MTIWGFHRIGKAAERKSIEQLEARRVRYSILPLIQAEADYAYLQREKKILKREAEIMKDVPGWKVGRSPYWSKRFMPRTVDDMGNWQA